MKFSACIFDLDGVICDSAKYHFLAWKRLADEIGIDFTEEDNERLKGVSRMQSLDIVLSLGESVQYTQKEKDTMASRKNAWYVEYISHMRRTELLPGTYDFLCSLRENNIKIALGSVSKNARAILNGAEITHLFDFIGDGNVVKNAKPAPDIFLAGAKAMQVKPSECIVFEDAVAGIEAAIAGGFYSVGIGKKEILCKADIVIQGFANFNYNSLVKLVE